MVNHDPVFGALARDAWIQTHADLARTAAAEWDLPDRVLSDLLSISDAATHEMEKSHGRRWELRIQRKAVSVIRRYASHWLG